MWSLDKLCHVAYAIAAWVGLKCLGYLPVRVSFVTYQRQTGLRVRRNTRSLSDPKERDRLLHHKLPVRDVCDLVAQYNAKFGAKLVHEFDWDLPTISSIAIVSSTRVALACVDDTVRVWDLWSSRCILTVKQPDVRQMVAIGTDTLACAGSTEVLVWDLSTGRRRSQIPLKAVYRMVNTVSGLAVISGAEHFLDVWDVNARDLLQYMGRHATSLGSIADGCQIVALFLDGIVRVFDVRTGRCVSKLAWHLEHVELAALSCGRVVLVTHTSLCIWDPNQRFATVFIDVPESKVDRGSDIVRVVAMLDHDTVVSMSSSGTWYAWDVITGFCLSTFTLPAVQCADCVGDRAARVKVMGSAVAFCSDVRVSVYQ